jgi:integrase
VAETTSRTTKLDRLPKMGPLGEAASEFLRHAGLRPSSVRGYVDVLYALAEDFPDKTSKYFDPPEGVSLVEGFLVEHWNEHANHTYNKSLSILHSFFRREMNLGNMMFDPTPGVPRRKRDVIKREVFSNEEVQRIYDGNPDLRDRVALRLLLDWGLSKGGLRNLRFGHVDEEHAHLVAVAHGGRQYRVPIPDDAFWAELKELRAASPRTTQPEHYVIPSSVMRWSEIISMEPDQPAGDHGLHLWWYRCLQRAGIVKPRVKRGHSMRKARQTAGQRWLDKTKSIKAVQGVLGHASIQTTWQTYSDLMEIGKLADELSKVIADEGDHPSGTSIGRA